MTTSDLEPNKLLIRLRTTEAALFVFSVTSILAGMGFLLQTRNPASGSGEILHVRGIVIEDAQGRARIILGAPTPSTPGRARSEPVNGILVLGPNGADRMVIAYPGLEPQVLGKVGKRSIAMPSAGLVINDSAGNERAGFGVSDDGNRVSLGLDYSDRDAMGLLVSPGFTGLAEFARTGDRNDQITLGISKDGTAALKLGEPNGDEHFIMEARKGEGPKLQMLNRETHKLQDVTSRLVP